MLHLDGRIKKTHIDYSEPSLVHAPLGAYPVLRQDRRQPLLKIFFQMNLILWHHFVPHAAATLPFPLFSRFLETAQESLFRFSSFACGPTLDSQPPAHTFSLNGDKPVSNYYCIYWAMKNHFLSNSGKQMSVKTVLAYCVSWLADKLYWLNMSLAPLKTLK